MDSSSGKPVYSSLTSSAKRPTSKPSEPASPTPTDRPPAGLGSTWKPYEAKSTKRARPETVASAQQWLRKAGMEALPPNHPERKQELRVWARWFAKQPNPEAFKNMA